MKQINIDVIGNGQTAGNLNWFPAVFHMKKFIENSVDSAKFLAYNDIEAESLLQDKKHELYRLLGALLSKKLSQSEKLNIIEKEY